MGDQDLDYVISTIKVEPEMLEKLDTKNTSKEKDGQTVRMPSQTNVCTIQLWEVYFVVAVLLLQPPSSVVNFHVKALCEHSEKSHLCEAILREHVIGMVADVSQDISLYTFFEEFLLRKFGISFVRNSLLKYLTDTLDDPLCGQHRIPRSFLVAPYVQEFILNKPFFDGQYDELADSMRMFNLPISDFLAEPQAEIGEATGLDWDAIQLYDDPTMILKKHGGWAITKGQRMIAPKDQLIMKLTGMTLDQILNHPQDVPDSPRREDETGEERKSRYTQKSRGSRMSMGGPGRASFMMKEDDGDDGESDVSSHPSDFDVDPNHPKITPLGLSLAEAYCLLRGLLVGEEGGWSKCVVAEPIAASARDGHPLAAAVLIDLYMREQVEVHHWTLSEGNVAVPYRVIRRKGRAALDHFLDSYSRYADAIFRDMRLPIQIGDYPIWESLEKRGIIQNHRSSLKRSYGIFPKRVEVWDFMRPDLLFDMKEAYLASARVLYDKGFESHINDEVANDTLMFVYVLQNLFDLSFQCIDGMARVLDKRCPPFQKGELFPPVSMVHSGAVCLGIVDRSFRIATHQSTQLAFEAAEYNEIVMERFERKFFLSPKVWESFDVDGSGELTLDEFVEGMRNIDVYKDFRKERIPDAVLRMIVSDLAERLFQEVDVNGDGTLTADELAGAFKRRREEALKEQAKKQWVRNAARAIADQVGGKKKTDDQEGRSAAHQMRDKVQARAKLRESRKQKEWSAEVEKTYLLDEELDVNAPLALKDE